MKSVKLVNCLDLAIVGKCPNQCEADDCHAVVSTFHLLFINYC